MREALGKRGFSEEVTETTVASLLEWGYLDDARYKENHIAQRKRNNLKGRKAVAYELYQAGITDTEDLEELYTDEEEQDCINRLLDRWEQTAPLSEENKNKYCGRLARRGFASRNIFHCMEIRRMEREIFS